MTDNNKPSGKFLYHVPCTNVKCGSSDGMAIYEQPDGSKDAYCFVCETYTHDIDGDTSNKVSAQPTQLQFENPEDYPTCAIEDRHINEGVATMYGVRTSFSTTTREPEAHYYPLTKNGKLSGWKKRKLPKSFSSIGDVKRCELFGQSVAKGRGSLVVITEGELDALSAYQMFIQVGKRYKVVSLPSGANIRSVKDNLEWIESHKTVVLAFDQDEAGEKAAKQVADLLEPGKVRIMSFSEKDPNDMLKEGKHAEFLKAFLEAEQHRPDGIVSIGDILEDAMKPVEYGLPWPWPSLTEKTYGRRRKELYGFGAGSGCGKTEGFKEIIRFILEEDNLPVGLLFLEESPETTARIIAGKLANKRFHIPNGDYTDEELEQGIKRLDGKVFLYNHFGQKDWDTLRSKIRYMVRSLGIKDIFLDHLTALVADEKDVNASLGRIMADMASLTQELDFTLYFISHLATPAGTPHEEGGRVTASQFRGSRTIMFWSHFLFGYERNQQAKDEMERNTTVFRVLKDRYTGMATGLTFNLFYDHETGRMEEVGDNILEFSGEDNED